MNTQMQLKEPMWPFTGRHVTLALAQDKIDIDLGGEAAGVLITVPWDKVDDVEYLAETFRELRVYEFEALVKGLGKAFKIRDAVQDV